jgi:hypothetical protein
MGWRDKYKVHPAADVFPMMSEDELQKLGADIKANGLREKIKFRGSEMLDGRNRMEAMERVGIKVSRGPHLEKLPAVDPVRFVISANIRRRHLTKQEQADLIVAVHKAAPVSRQDGEKLPEGRPVDPVKAAAVTTAAEHGISQRTVERAFAKAEGRTPKPKAEPVEYETVPHVPEPGWKVTATDGETVTLEPDDDDGEFDVDLVDPGEPLPMPKRKPLTAAEIETACACVAHKWDTSPPEVQHHLLNHIAKESDPVALAARLLEMMDSDQLRRFCVMVDQHKLNVGRKRASTLPTEPRSEVGVDDPMPENEGDDLELPACLDRRSVQKERAASS